METDHLYLVYFRYSHRDDFRLAFGMVYMRMIRSLDDAEEMNRGLGMLEAGRFQWHVAGVLGVSQNTVARMRERFQILGRFK